MQNDYVPHNRPTLGIEEEKAAIRVLKAGWVAQGVEVKKFEDEFCDFLNIDRGLAVAVSSGTAALYLSLLALKAQGRKVAYPAYVCSAVRHAITLAGGKQQLMDSSQSSPNIKLSSYHSSSDIILVPHMYGIPQEIHSYNSL